MVDINSLLHLWLMDPRYKEPGNPRGRDYVLGIVFILGLTALGIFMFGLNWSLGGASATAIWLTVNIYFFMSLGRLIRGIYKLQFNRSQTQRDKFATHVASEKREDFCLYLRPFNSTGRLRITLRVTEGYIRVGSGQYPKKYSERENIDMETELARALETYAPIVALGRPGEYTGAGRIETDDEKWQSLFVDLASRAISIFVVPATTQGTQWELDRLANDQALLKKTLLIIPPEPIEADDTLLHRFDVGILGHPGTSFHTSLNSEAVKALAARGISLQHIEPRRSNGLLIRYNDPSIYMPIINYTEPATYRGLLGWYLNKDLRSLKMAFGLRNAIFSIEPGLAERQELPLKLRMLAR